MFLDKSYKEQLSTITNLQSERRRLQDLYKVKDPEVKTRRSRKPKKTRSLKFPTKAHKEFFDKLPPKMQRLLS